MADLAASSNNGSIHAAMPAVDETGRPGSDVIRHVRLSLDVLCAASNVFFIRVLAHSSIRGTHSFRVLSHSAVSDLLLCAFSVVMYFVDVTSAAPHWKVYVASRLQTTFIMTSFYCDFLLVINIFLAVTLGVAYKVKVTRRNITSGLVASWTVACGVGIFAFTISLVNYLYEVRTAVILSLSLLVSFFTLLVPAGSIVVLFRRISVFIRLQASTHVHKLCSILNARLEFVRVLKILLGLRVLLYAIFSGVTISMMYFGLSQSFEILCASNIAYSFCRVVIYLCLKKPLRLATTRAVQSCSRCCISPQSNANVLPMNFPMSQSEV